jgi:hypothetical protein
MRPIYITVVFWGETYRNQFATLLLPSLLAPGNLAAIRDLRGSKLVICTTRDDWDALRDSPLFKEMTSLIQPMHIEIPFPERGANKYLHNSFAFKLAIQHCWQDRAYASLLSPDVILSNGTLAYLRQLAERGMDAVLAPALRFEMYKCQSLLASGGIFAPGRPLVASGRQLAAVAAQGLHSELLRFEWASPQFCRQPISVWWRLPHKRGVLVHTTSWAMVLVNFNALSEMRDESLSTTTLDAVFILENFFHLQESNRLHLVTDTDDMFMLPLTGEFEMTFFPLKALFLNRIPLLGRMIKFRALQLFLAGPTFDAFRRWAVTNPVFIHADPLVEQDRKQALATTRLLRRANIPPDRLTNFYVWLRAVLPMWRYPLSIVVLLFTSPREFSVKFRRRLTKQRREDPQSTSLNLGA